MAQSRLSPMGDVALASGNADIIPLDTNTLILEGPPLRNITRDLLLLDIDAEDMATEIKHHLNIEVFDTCNFTRPKWPVTGFFLSANRRQICALPVALSKGKREDAVWVGFVRSSGCPMTYLSRKTLERLGVEKVPDEGVRVWINGCWVYVFQTPQHEGEGEGEGDVNILGQNFLSENDILSVEKHYPPGEQSFAFAPKEFGKELLAWAAAVEGE